jgi:hypothetical protein
MKFTSKEYKTLKTKKYLKSRKLFFFFNGIYQNTNHWIKTEQELKNINCTYYKVFNKTSTKNFENSIYKHFKFTISSITFFIQPDKSNKLMLKKTLFNLNSFIFLAIKMNTKIYSSSQINYLYSFYYYNNKLLFYKFLLTSIKNSFLIK